MIGYGRHRPSYLYELLSDKIAQVIYVRVERITPGRIPVFRCRFITAAKRYIKRFS
jgi:hypothetical protein